MAWVISVLGALLALGGGYALANGLEYIRLDWGQAETVAGTVSLSAGIVTIALAAVLFALRGLARPPARALGESLAAPALPAGRPGPVVERAATPPGGTRLVDEAPPADGPDLRPPRADRAPEPRALPDPPAPAAEAPTVVGRYEANGASYVLFSDGTIEVETEGGTHRFESMAHLRDHIERQDAT